MNSDKIFVLNDFQIEKITFHQQILSEYQNACSTGCRKKVHFSNSNYSPPIALIVLIFQF